MNNKAKSIWLALGVVIGVGGTIGSQFVIDQLSNGSSSSEWVIPYNQFGEYEIEAIDNDLIFDSIELPDYVDDLNWDEFVQYGNDYIVSYFTDSSIYYDDERLNYREYHLSRINENGVKLWTFSFEFEELYAIASGIAYSQPIQFNHMELEGDTLIIVAEFANRIRYFDSVVNEYQIASNGTVFNTIGGGSSADDYVQSFLKFDIETQTLNILAVNDSDTELRYNPEDFVRLAPHRYAIAQEFDNELDEAFSHNYHGETLVFTEFTNTIALLTEVTVQPNTNTATFDTIGKWSSTDSIDIDLDPIRDQTQTRLPVMDSGFIVLNVYMTNNNMLAKDTPSMSRMTASDDILTTAQQTLIDQASTRFSQDVNMTYLRYEFFAVLNLNFELVSNEFFEVVRTFSSNTTYLNAYVLWLEANQFVFVNYQESFNSDGVLVDGNTTINFKNGDTTTKTLNLDVYGKVIAFEFFIDDAGNMIVAGQFIGNDEFPVSELSRFFVLFIDKDFNILDEFLFDGDGSGVYIYRLVVEANEILVYFRINQHAGMFEAYASENQYDFILTLPLA
jgi:hypothetical protein